MKPRLVIIVSRYPQLSETYIKAEIEAIREDFEILVVTNQPADLPCRNHVPYVMTNDADRISKLVAEFRPHVMHAHYLHLGGLMARLSREGNIPYTIRTHSFDVLGGAGNAGWEGTENCLGVLAFPFARERLLRRGVPEQKLVDCYPVVDFDRFHDRGPNGDAILNIGATLPKKLFSDYVDLAVRMPGRTFNLYAIGYELQAILDYNDQHGRPVTLCPTVEPEAMPAVYKRHAWLVYTACPKMNTVGWPIAVAEAQAAGLGVCMPRIRPDLEEYLGGAGFLYDSVDELPEILARPYPEAMRERGFQQARKSDVRHHKAQLTALWKSCL